MRYRKLTLDEYEATAIRNLVFNEYWRLRRQRVKMASSSAREAYLFIRRLQLSALRKLLKKLDRLLEGWASHT